MRVLKIVAIVLIVGGVSMAARQLFNSRGIPDRAKPTDQGAAGRKHLKVVAEVAREKYGEYSLRDLALLDNGDIWAVGYDGKHVNRLYVSRDRGKNWQPIEVRGNDFTMQAITFSDSQHGWAVGGNGLIIRTTDGGQSWVAATPPTTNDLHAVGFADPLVGYVAAGKRVGNKTSDEVSGSFEIFCTNDGGRTWNRCYQVNEPLTAFQITAVSQSVAFVVLGNQLIMTDNQGKTWQASSTAAKYISSIAFAPDGTGWLVGSHGVFQQSIDGGKSWHPPASLAIDSSSREWGAISFSRNGTGLAVGENGTLALTTDNGKTWQIQPATQDHLRGVRIQQSKALILGAEKLYSIEIIDGL